MPKDSYDYYVILCAQCGRQVIENTLDDECKKLNHFPVGMHVRVSVKPFEDQVEEVQNFWTAIPGKLIGD